MKDALGELFDMIQRAYGVSKNYAERELNEFQRSLRPVVQPVVVKPQNQKR